MRHGIDGRAWSGAVGDAVFFSCLLDLFEQVLDLVSRAELCAP
jgi:hypothetical protein